MKIRSLLLGSVALAGLSTAGYAADLGVTTALDVCDSLGLTGLTISSDDNCLQVSGQIKMEYDVGDYTKITYADFGSDDNDAYTVLDNKAGTSKVDIDTWLKVVGTSSTDFGPASITIKLISEDNTGTKDWTLGIDEAWVGIGDTTVIQAGYKSSIFADGSDEPLNYLGTFNSESVDAGVGFKTKGAATEGAVIQAVTTIGDGVKLAGGIENLGAKAGEVTGVAVISYAGDSFSGHVSLAADTDDAWKIHAGFTGSWDPVTVVAAISADDTDYWNGLASLSAKFDIFTLAASVEGATDGVGVGGSLSANVTDTVTLNLGGRYWDSNGKLGTNDAEVTQLEAGLSAAVTDTVKLTGAVGFTDSTKSGLDQVVYGKAGLAWAPGGGFTSSVTGTVTSLGGYKAVFKAAKTLK